MRFENPKKRYHGVTQTCFETLDRNVLLKDYDMTTPFPVQKIKRTVVVSCLCSLINSLSPNINIKILHTDLYTLP